MTTDRIRYRLDVDTARLDWDPTDDGEALQAAVSGTAEWLLAQGARRLEVELPATDPTGRRATLRSGFRVEGVRRAVLETAPGVFDDTVLYSRLASDLVGGAHGFSAVMNTALPRKRMIAHVLMRDAAGRILLCDTRFKQDWELPGGIVEHGEPPRVGAAREVQEELGVVLELGRLLIIDWMPPYLGWDDAVELIFDGGAIESHQLDALTLQPTEIKQVALVTLEQAADLVTPLSHRRLTVAAALAPGEIAYLQDGRHP